MISAISWVPRGAAKSVPEMVEPTEAELEEMRLDAMAEQEEEDSDDGLEDEGNSSDSEMEEEDNEQAVERARAVANAIKSSSKKSKDGASSASTGALENALNELDMDNYDDDDEVTLPGLLGGSLGGSKKDPYLKLGSDDEDSEIEDFNIRDSDLLILAGRHDEDVSNLEVWLYEEAAEDGEANLYVHHEIMLSSFPLSLAWMDCNPNGSDGPGNFVAVGTFAPEIELWNLDVVDAVTPVANLGGVIEPELESLGGEAEGLSSADRKKLKKKVKKKNAKKQPTLKEGSHENAVLGLSWNPEFRNVLASASADCTVKVWDVTTQACSQTLTHHAGKVQAVTWNPAQATVMLTGGFDSVAALVDSRTPESCLKWTVSKDVEAMTWCPHAPTCFLVSCEDGLVTCYDARKGAGSKPLYSLHAHDKPTCTLSFSPGAPGLLCTGSTDKKLKLWDVSDNTPSLIASQDPKVGAIFSAGFCSDSPFLVAAAGAKGTVAVWDVMTNAAVAAKYGKQ